MRFILGSELCVDDILFFFWRSTSLVRMRTVNRQPFFENDILINRRHGTNINPFQVLSAPSTLGPETLLTNEGTKSL